MLILTGKDLLELLTVRDVIEAVEDGFRALARGDVRVPERLMLTIPESGGVVLEMPAYACALSSGHGGHAAESALGTKVVSVFERNRVRGLDAVQSTYLLLDSETGAPLALMDGKFITAIRTAATSAVATRLLATSGPKRMAIFGSGVQARFHIEAMSEIASVEKIFIASRTTEKAMALAEETRSRLGIPCEVATSEDAVAKANLICTCTGSPAPLFDGGLLSAGTHINAVGAFTPSTRELDTETIRRARVVIDHESAAGREAGDLLIPLSEGAIDKTHISGSLAEVVSGRLAGRQSPDEITLFKSCGLAVEDLVTARLAYDRAIAQSKGTHVNF